MYTQISIHTDRIIESTKTKCNVSEMRRSSINRNEVGRGRGYGESSALSDRHNASQNLATVQATMS